MKTVLVTGGNRGIGLEICRQLEEMGHSVIMGSRNLIKGQEAARSLSNNVLVTQLDVTDAISIERSFDFVKNKYGRLDVLINNAGLGPNHKRMESSSLYKAANSLESRYGGLKKMKKIMVPILRTTGIISKKATAASVALGNVKDIMETNFYGAWHMVQVFLPLLDKNKDGRIINVSSGMGELNSLTGEYPGYSISKASLNALTIMLANELGGKGIKVNAICPGWVRTDMGGPNAPRDVFQGADTAVWLATEKDIPTGKFFRDREVISW